MMRPCASCGHTLQPTAKFCDECGASVAASTPGATVDPTSGDGAVRRIVTIMFADLVGSTAFGESVDAETARREMAGYHALAREVVEDHGGGVVKFIGDGVMAGFGLTDVAEDDADRAVRAGIALQRAFDSIVTRIRDRHGAEVSLRVGINTGEVVVAEGDADIVGDAINTAARIEAQCTPGRVLVGEQTWRLTRSGVDYEVLGEVEVKGKSDPIATFQVVAAVEDEEVATPFVGRQDELATLTAHLEDTIASASPQLVTVIGSPGVGKTRLAAELAGRASEVTSFDIRVDRAGAATFEPIADLLRTVSGLPSGLDAEATIAHLAEFVGTDDAERLVPILASFLGAGPARSTEESLWGSRRLVELITTDQPAVIVVDDIQWAEPLFHDLLEHLVEWVEGAAFIVALARPEIREIRPAFAEAGRRISEVVRLDGLDPSTTAELASGILGGKALPPGLAERLPASTDGNPLFARELVRMLVDDGTITEGDDRWVLAIDIDAIDVPPTIISLLASRVERMASEERRVVEAASVVGSEFARGAVHALLPDLGVAQLDRLLEQLRRQELIDATGTYWGDEPVWRFHHVLIRDAAYRRLLKERRAELHRQVGDWTEAAAADVRGEHEITIGYHFEQAFGYLDELGPLDETARSLGARAANLFATAATRSVERDDLAAAGPLAGRALAVLPADDRRRGDLLLLACESFFGAGRVNEGTPWFEELRAYPGNERIAAWTSAYEGEYVVLTDPDRLDEIEPVVDAAADQLAELGDDSGVAKARLVRAQIMARTGRVAECEGELDAALAAARAAGDRRRITAVLGAAPLAALWGPSPVARAGGRCLDIIRLLRITSASPMVEATSIRCQAVLEGMRGRFDEARNLIDRSRAIVDELGLRRGILECRLFAGYIELLAGNPAVAEAHLRVAHAGLASLGVRSETGQAAGLLSQALFELDRIEEASDLAEESALLAGRNLQAAITAHAAQARIAMATGRHDDAVRFGSQAVSIAAGTDLTMDHAQAAAELAQVHAAADDHAAAATTGRIATDLYEAKGAVVRTRTRADAPIAGEPSEGTGLPTTETPALSNHATDISHRFYALLMDDGDVDAALSLQRDDWEARDHRELVAMHVRKADQRGNYVEVVAAAGTHNWKLEPIALRGEHHALFRFTSYRDGSSFRTEYHQVVETDGNLTVRTAAFAADDLIAALDLLDEWYEESLTPGEAAVLSAHRAEQRARGRGDHAAAAATAADDGEFVDHRNGQQFTTRFHDRAFDSQASANELTGAVYDQQIHRLTDRGIVASVRNDFRDSAGSPVLWPTIVVQMVDAGRLTRWEVFDADDAISALARFDELTTDSTPLDNLAVRWSQRGAALASEGRLDAVTPEVRADFVSTDHRFTGQGSGDAEWQASAIRARAEFGARFTSTPLETRGDRFAMMAWSIEETHDFETVTLVVCEVDEDGIGVRNDLFDIDDRFAAARLLDQWYRDALEEGEQLVLDSLLLSAAHQRSGDREAFLALLGPDFVGVDHRVGGFGTVDRDGWADRNASFAAVAEGFTNDTLAIHEINERGMLAELQLGDAAGNEWRFLALGIAPGGIGQRTEIFEARDLAAARRRLTELTAPAERPPTHAESWYHRALELMNTEDEAGMRAATAPDFVSYTYRNRAGGGTFDVDEFIRGSIGSTAVFGTGRAEILATRGEMLVLGRTSWGSDESSEFSILCVVQHGDDGVATRMASFDDHAFNAAEALLDEWYADSLPEVERRVFEQQLKGVEAQRAADRDALDRLMPDHFVAVDRRRGGTLHLDRGMWIDANANFATISEGFVNRLVSIRLTARAALLEMQFTDADDHEWSFLAVSLVEGGVPQRIELFDPSDRVAADALFEGWTVGEGNAASESYLRHLRAIFDLQDAELALAELGDDIHAEDRRPLVAVAVGKDQFVANWQRPLTAERPVWWEVNAVHTFGDCVAVIEWQTGPGLEFATVAAVGDHGLAVNHTTYGRDQFDEACAYARELAAADSEHHNRAFDVVSDFWRLVLTEGDIASATALNDPNCETVDRRRMMGDQHLEAEAAAYYTELIQPVGTSVPHEIVRLAIDGDDRALIRLTAADPDGAWAYEVVQLVELSPSGLIRRAVTHSAEDEAQARAEFAATTGEGAAVRTSSELTNAATGWAIAHHDELATAEIIAITDVPTALLRTTKPQPMLHVVSYLEGEGVLTSYPPERFFEARADLHERTAAALPESQRAAAVVFSTFGAMVGNPDGMAAMITDDFISVDHGQLSTGELHADGVRDYQELRRGDGTIALPRRILDRSSSAVLFEHVEVDADYEWRRIIVMTARGERIDRLELWDADAEAEARARFEELVRGMEPSNAASDLFIQQHVEIFDNQDLEAALAFVHPEATGEDRRSVITEVTITREQFADNYRQALDAEEPIPWTSRVLHTIGDRIAVVRLLVGSHYDWVTAIEINGDGLGIRAVNFDYAQLDEAVAEAARWHEEQT